MSRLVCGDCWCPYDEDGQCGCAFPESTARTDSTGTAFVDQTYYWRHMATCPIGLKVQLRNASGVAVHGSYNGRDTQWTGWTPLPKDPEWLK